MLSPTRMPRSSAMRAPRMMPGGFALGSRRRSSEPALRRRKVLLKANSEFTSTPLMTDPLGLERSDQEGGVVEHGRHRRDVRHLTNAIHHGLPVFDAVAGGPRHHVDVRHGAQQIALQGVAEAVGHGQGNHQRGDAGRDAEHGDGGDHGDHRLLAARAQVASGDEELEAPHSLSSSRRFPIRSMGPSGRSSGKRITSRMEREPVRIMVKRSIPMPSPPVGGMP